MSEQSFRYIAWEARVIHDPNAPIEGAQFLGIPIDLDDELSFGKIVLAKGDAPEITAMLQT